MARSACTVVAQSPNGVVSPLYFDRQIVRAEDLTLDRSSHDAELMRMRRLLHGWGIVAGLIPVTDGKTLTVTAGYAISPSGEEVYLTKPLRVDDVIERIWKCCGPDAPGCELDAGDKERDAADTVTAWLIARPTRAELDLRPGVPAGCAHPANSLMPSRVCEGVGLNLICDLPELHLPKRVSCADLSAYVCGNPKTGFEPLPMPAPVAPEDDFVVIARIVAGHEGVVIHLDERRALLPVSILQDWLTTCVCGLLTRASEPTPSEPAEPEPTQPEPGRGGRDIDWTDFTDRLRENGVIIQPDPGVVDPPPPDVLLEAETIKQLTEAGISGPVAFLNEDPARIAEVTGLNADKLKDVQKNLEVLRPFMKTGTF